MTIETRKIKIAQRVLGNLSEDMIERLESLLRIEEKEQEEMVQRALESEQNIKDGKVYNMEEAMLRVENALNR